MIWSGEGFKILLALLADDKRKQWRQPFAVVEFSDCVEQASQSS